MKYLILFSFLLLNIQLLFGQYEEIKEEAWFQNQYFGDYELYEVVQAKKYKEPSETRQAFESIAKRFEAAGNWEAYIGTRSMQVETYSSTQEYQEGIDIGTQTLLQIKEKTPTYLPFTYAIHRSLGRVYESRNLFDEALESYTKQKDLLEANFQTTETYWYGSSYNDIGGVYNNLGKFEEAISYLKKAIEIGESESCPNCNQLIANASTNLGTSYNLLGMLEEASEYIQSGVNLYIESIGEFDLNIVPQYFNLARLYWALEEYEKQCEVLQKALFVIDNSGTKEERFTKTIKAFILDDYGYANAQLFRFKESEKAFRQLIELVEGDQYELPRKIAALVGISKNKYELGAYDEAKNYLDQADSLNTHTQRISGGQADDVMDLINLNYSNLYRIQEDYEKAIFYHLKHATSKHFSSEERTSGYSDLAHLYLINGQLDSAAWASTKVFQYGSKRFRPKSFFDLPEATKMRDYRELYDALWVRSKIAEGLAMKAKDTVEAAKYWNHLIDVLKLADEFHQSNLKKMVFLRGAKSKAILSEHNAQMRIGVGAIYNYYQFNQDEKWLDKILENVQKIKGHQLWLKLLDNEASGFGKLPNELIIKERDLLAEIQEYEKQLRKAKRKKDENKIQEIQNDYLFNSQKAYEDLKKMMAEKYPEYYEAKYDIRAETSSSLQALMEHDEVLIEWVVESDALMTLVLEKGKPLHIIKSNISEQIDTAIIELSNLLETSSVMRKNKRNTFIKNAHLIYQELIKPLEPFIKDKRRLILIPDDVLYYIPFEALLASNETKSFNELNFLIEDYEISYHYSSKLFAKARRTVKTENTGIYAFAPIYDNDVAVSASKANSNLRSTIDETGNFAPLPESEKEVKEIEGLFERKGRSHKIALREEALEKVLKENLEKNHQFIHIAGHSFADEENANFSGIACYPSSQDDDDHILYAGEAAYLDIQADLITLSSCESGFGKLKLSEGLLGLNRSFVYAGAPNVLFSLWKVYDKVSAKLMVDFYKNVLEGDSYSKSLRAAKLELLNKKSTANPHFWAPYLLIGR